MNTDLNTGLSSFQAEQRKAAGESNGGFEIRTKSVGRIFRDNLFTLFNLINAILAFMVAMVGSYRNMLFLGVVISNTAIGIIQEIRSKRVIDRLSLISAPKARLLRDGKERELAVSEIVRDDLMLLSSGQQICADGVILEGECEVDESLITGESDPILKRVGDELLSGSFVVSGSVKAQAVRVGAQSYSNTITSGAKQMRKQTSEMMRAINKIITVVSVCIFPFGAVLLFKALAVTRQTFERGVVSTAAALIGMIPEGLVLLTSIALAVSSIRLARKKTLCQDLYCVESLARVDVICLDKTGTITEGKMEISEVIPIDPDFDIDGALRALSSSFDAPNTTLKAIRDAYSAGTPLKLTQTIPFSSARKWSAAEFEGAGTFVLGAPDFVLNKADYDNIRRQAEEYSGSGMRVLLLAHGKAGIVGRELPEGLSAKALIILSDKIRESAPATLEYFKKQGVALKVISGDDPVTVSHIAKRAGLDGAEHWVDAQTLNDSTIAAAAEEFTVFGRVTPYQKQQLVKALKDKGHKVAMTGDGVNDVLALKEADCSVAMQSGSDAARCVSQLVLLDSDFANMPLVLEEGRRVINNIQRSAALFLVKTIFSFLMAVVFLFLPLPYPFQPIQMTLISALTIGVPSFLLALEENHDIVSGSFITNVFRKAAPGGISATLGIGVLLVMQNVVSISQEQLSTMAVFLTWAVFFGGLFLVCKPLNIRRGVMLVLLFAAFLGAALLLGELFYLAELTLIECVTLIASTGIALLCLKGLSSLFQRLLAK